METGAIHGDSHIGGTGTADPGAAVMAGGPAAAPYLPNDNAPHATLPVRPTDRAVRAGCLVLARLWRLTGLRNASGALRHYLGGTGETYRIDASTLVALPPVRAAVNTRLMEAEAGRWSHRDTWHGVTVTPATSLDWWLAVRGVQFRVERPNPDFYRVEFHKTWNFDRGESAFGIPFTLFARLHETGLAWEFVAVGRTGYLPR
ncbi:hypothetical protein ACIP93_23005 [Streptomyces sp. NPDC088745]|uniref:hypothetical protein n=1 Tax=Streptomyces sp. NPDC088745 TaxID=3365884 RepID=UPI003803D68A